MIKFSLSSLNTQGCLCLTSEVQPYRFAQCTFDHPHVAPNLGCKHNSDIMFNNIRWLGFALWRHRPTTTAGRNAVRWRAKHRQTPQRVLHHLLTYSLGCSHKWPRPSHLSKPASSVATVMIDAFRRNWIMMPEKLAKTVGIFVEIEHINIWEVTFCPKRIGRLFPTLWSGHEFGYKFG